MKKFSLGLDMAARSFFAALWLGEERVAKKSFPNDRAGFERLGRWLQSHGVGLVRAGIECTNVYGEALAYWLHEHGHEVYLLNPQTISYYARVRSQQNKTDPADAVTIAAYVAQQNPTRWIPPTPEQRTLSLLTRARADLLKQSLALANQLRTAHPEVAPFLKNAYQALKAEIKAIEAKLRLHLKQYPTLSQKVHRLMTIQGIGWLTAVIAIGELPPIDAATDVRTICAWAGLIPRRRQSGKTELPARLSKRGNEHLRRALYMPALTAITRNPVLKTFAYNLAQRGKRKLAIIGAVSHKLLRIIVGLLKSNADFDPNWALSKN